MDTLLSLACLRLDCDYSPLFSEERTELKIGDIDVESLHKEFDSLGKRITDGFKRIEISKESI